MKPQSPCKQCSKRQLGCHSTCQGYKDYQTANQADKQKRLDDKVADELYSCYHKENFRSRMRKRGKKV